MHSRVFQVSLEPLDVDEYITEEDLYENPFVGTIADYVSDNCNRTEDIQWLISYISKYDMSYNTSEGSITFKKGFRKEYFKTKYEEFQEYARKITFEVFMDSMGYELYKLEKCIEDKFGFYIYSDENGLETLDSFVRRLEADQKYYVGGTVDYHS
jgi:hypothetical protein